MVALRTALIRIAGAAVVGALLLFGALSFDGSRSMLARAGIAIWLASHGMRLGGDLRVTSDRLIATDIEIDDVHGRVFSIARLAIDFDWRGLVGRGDRRYGLRAIDVQKPALRLLVLPDGSTNLASFVSSTYSQPARSGYASGKVTPFDCRLRVSGGRIDVENPTAFARPGRSFSIDAIDADVTLHRGRDVGQLRARYAAEGTTSPISAALSQDDAVGFAEMVVVAPSAALAPPLDAFVSTPHLVFERGVADVTLRAFDAGYAAERGPAWQWSGRADVRDGRLRIAPFVAPARDLAGTLHLSGGYLGFEALRGDIASIPVRANGSLRLLGGDMRLTLRLHAAGDLKQARALFAASRRWPAAGPFAATLRVDGPIDGPRVAGDVTSGGVARFGKAPLKRLQAFFYYNEGHVTLERAEAGYAGGTLWGDGDIDLTAQIPIVQMRAGASLPAADVPLVASLNRQGSVQAQLSLSGPVDSAEFNAFARTFHGDHATMRAAVAGRFGEAAYGAATVAWRGGDITARTAYEHAPKNSAAADPSRPDAGRALFASIVASHAPLRLWSSAVALPGVTPVIPIPASSGVIDGAAVLHGSDDASGALRTAVDLRGRAVVIAGEALDDVRLRAHGVGPRIAVDEASIAGRDVRLRARGAARIDPASLEYSIALRGAGSLNLDSLPAVAGIAASGRADGGFEAAINSGGWAASLSFPGGAATVGGVPVRDASLVASGGGGDAVRFAASAGALGGTVSAAGALGAATGVWASGIDLHALRAAGLPLDAGTATIIGNATPSRYGTALTAGIALTGGRYRRTPLDGDVDIVYDGGDVRVTGRVDVSGTRANVRGIVSGVAAGTPLDRARLILDGSVRDGDVQGVLGAYLPAGTPLTGTLNARASVRGSVRDPQIAGDIGIGAGTVRGVTFTETRTTFDMRGGAIALRGGHTQLGSSVLEFDGRYAPNQAMAHATSSHMDLSDINDFFEGYNALQGLGDGDIAVSFARGSTVARGGFQVDGAEVGGVPLGTVGAALGGAAGDGLHAVLAQSGELGSSGVIADIRFHRHRQVLPDFGSVAYSVTGNVYRVDLGLAARFVGLEDLGLRGRVDASGRAVGTPRHTSGTASFAIHDGYLRKVPLRSAQGTLSADAATLSLRSASVELPFGSATAAGSLTRRGAVAGIAQFAVTDLSGVTSLLGIPAALRGSATGTLAIAGDLHAPRYTAFVRAGKGSAFGVAFDGLSAHASYAREALEISDTTLALGGGGNIDLAGSLPLQLKPFALGPAGRRMDVRVRGQKINLAAFDPLITGFGTLGGTLDVTASATGSAGKPDLAGTASLRGGQVTTKFQRTPLRDIRADVALSHDSIAIEHLLGTVGAGSFSGAGAVNVVPAVGLRASAGLSYHSRLDLHAVPLDIPGWLAAVVSGDISMNKSGATPFLSGNLSLRNGLIPLSAIYELATKLGETSGAVQTKNIPGVPALLPGHTIAYGGGIYPPGTHLLTQRDLATPPPTLFDLPSVNLGLSMTAQNVRVRGGPLDLTAHGALAIDGSVRDPQLSGRFIADRGQLSTFGTTFHLQSGTLTFDPDQGVLPSIDAKAVSNTSGDRVTVVLSGRIDHLDTQITSSAGDSPEQILASFVGVSSLDQFTGSGGQQVLLGEAQRIISAELTRNILGSFSTALAQTLNVEDVSLGFDQNSNLVVEVRKYVTPTVSLLYRSTTTAPVTQAYGVAYQLRDSASLDFLSTVAPQGFVTYLMDVKFTFK